MRKVLVVGSSILLAAAVLAAQQPQQRREELMSLGVVKPEAKLDSIGEAFLRSFDLKEKDMVAANRVKNASMVNNQIPPDVEAHYQWRIGLINKSYKDTLAELCKQVLPILPKTTSKEWMKSFTDGAKGNLDDFNPVQASIYLKSLIPTNQIKPTSGVMHMHTTRIVLE